MFSAFGGCHFLFGVMNVVTVSQVLVGVAVPEEGDDKPNEEGSRDCDRHDQVFQFVTKVHELGDDIECLGAGQDQIDPVDDELWRETGFKMDRSDDQFHDGNDQEDPERSPDRLCIEMRLGVIAGCSMNCMSIFHNE